MDDIIAPTCEQLMEEEGLSLVETTRWPWRHGNWVVAIYHRLADETHWAVRYTLSTDGETNGLRDGDAEISRCWPFQKVVTAFSDREPEVGMDDVVEIVRRRIDALPIDMHSIPNCDVRLLILEIDRLRTEAAEISGGLPPWRVALGAGGPLKPDHEGS